MAQRKKTQKKKDNNSDIRGLCTIIVILLAVVIAASIVCGKMAEVNTSWGFWGGLWGGAIGGIATIITITYTLKYYTNKDTQQKYIEMFRQQDDKVCNIITAIQRRDAIPDDMTYTINLPKKILKTISNYNVALSRWKGRFTEIGADVIKIFMQESGCFNIGEKANDSNGNMRTGEFLSLPDNLKGIASRIGRLALYQNAEELLQADDEICYIIERERGGSGSLWAEDIHGKHTKFHDNDSEFDEFQKFLNTVQELLEQLDIFRQQLYDDIVVRHESAASKFRFVRSQSKNCFFGTDRISVEEKE